MSTIKLELENKKDIVLFQFLYSQNQHLGWPRSNRLNPKEITIYTTDDLMESNRKILVQINNHVKLKAVTL
ncbi:MAG: hypothetical protein VYB18_00100 [Thermodesulfobacteriota bacterium]|nr:hypothetical protein [Thermodesulfobacteriota bacterium]